MVFSLWIVKTAEMRTDRIATEGIGSTMHHFLSIKLVYTFNQLSRAWQLGRLRR